MKKILAIGIMLLFMELVISSSIGFNLEIRYTVQKLDEDTLYVGGSGPNNYTKIQDAIDNSSHGDTVFVYNGTYIENVKINKSIRLIGEDKNTTYVYGNTTHWDKIFKLTTGNIEIKGFTVQNGTAGILVWADQEYIENIHISECDIINNKDEYGGLCLKGHWIFNTTISHCNFDNNEGLAVRIEPWYTGISNTTFSHCYFDKNEELEISGPKNITFADCDFVQTEINMGGPTEDNIQFYNCTIDSSNEIALSIGYGRVAIENCTFTISEYSWEAIRIYYSDHVLIRNCVFTNNNADEGDGITFFSSNNILVERCVIENMWHGIFYFGTKFNVTVKNCHIVNNDVGVWYEFWTIFHRYIQNNFVNNTDQFINEGWFIFNIYKSNYWSDWDGSGPYNVYRYFNWDLHPAKEPYDI